MIEKILGFVSTEPTGISNRIDPRSKSSLFAGLFHREGKTGARGLGDRRISGAYTLNVYFHGEAP